MNELKAMRIFTSIVDKGGFAAASRSLDLAPPVVTRIVAELERHLGTRLLTRTTRRTELTEIGSAYLERVRHILQDVADAEAMARQAQTEPCGAVRVAVPPAFAAHQLAHRLGRFHERYPQVRVELTTIGPVESPHAAHDISIVVRQPQLDGQFVARRLARSEVIACASPRYLARHGRPRHPAELAAHRLLLPPSQRGLTFRRADAEADAPADPYTVAPPRLPLCGMDPDMQYAVALAGEGIAGLASFAAEHALRERSLERVLPGWRLHDLSIWACTPSRHVPASTRAFLDFLVDEFGCSDKDPWSPQPTAYRSEGKRQAEAVH